MTAPDPDDIISAVRDAVSGAMPEVGDIIEAVRSGVWGSMPYAGPILDALQPDPLWSPLPPGSHLRLGDENERGVDIVAVRTLFVHGVERAEALTERGGVTRLDKDCRLTVGRRI